MSEEVHVQPQAWRQGGQDLQRVADEVGQAIGELVGAAGDPSALGGNDMVGGIAAAIYQGVIDYLNECTETLKASYGEHGGMLGAAADAFEQNEAANVASINATSFTRGR